MCMFSFTSEGFNIFELADKVREKGFYMQPQFTHFKTPANLHVSLGNGTADSVDGALAMLREAVAEVKMNPDPIELEQVRATVHALLADLGEGAGDALRAMAGISEGGLPTQMALINSVFDALPDEVAENMLSDYMNQVFV